MDKEKLLRNLPAVHELLSGCTISDCPLQLLTEAAREVIASARRGILEKGDLPPKLEAMTEQVMVLAQEKMRMDLRPVVNATGVVLHTNLGRSPLSDAALKAVIDVARGYCNLEIDLESGKRGERYSHVEKLLCELTGAEAALVVNNNAGAVLLALHALARGREVITARGELVEIGGSFRVPEVMVQSGASLREVGTTNRTYPEDYEKVINDDTALILKVHPSNFRVLGFTREVTREELVVLGDKYQVPVMEDLGSGVLVSLQKYGLGSEPTVQEALSAGIDIVTVSGDKLLGGPQAGVILGKAKIIQLLKQDQLLRALRIDKLTLAALEATLRHYLWEEAQENVPILKMLSVTAEELEDRAGNLKELLAASLKNCEIILKPGVSRVGGGSLPLAEPETTLLALYPREISPETLAERLRRGEPPVVVRLQEEGVLIDPRTLMAGDEAILLEALRGVLGD